MKQEIKHRFELENGITVEMMIKVIDSSIFEIWKSIYPNGYCEYTSGEYYLDSFDDSHNKDYPIEELMETITLDGRSHYKNCYWDHP